MCVCFEYTRAARDIYTENREGTAVTSQHLKAVLVWLLVIFTAKHLMPSLHCNSQSSAVSHGWRSVIYLFCLWLHTNDRVILLLFIPLFFPLSASCAPRIPDTTVAKDLLNCVKVNRLFICKKKGFEKTLNRLFFSLVDFSKIIWRHTISTLFLWPPILPTSFMISSSSALLQLDCGDHSAPSHRPLNQSSKLFSPRWRHACER